MNSSDNNNSCIITPLQTSVGTIASYTSVTALQSILIIFTNTLILTSVIKFPRLRLTSNILIANLAICDLLVGVFLLPVNLSGVLNPAFIDTKLGCVLRGFIWVFVFGSGFISLFLISIDRLFAITLPLKYKTSNIKPIAIGICIGSWMFWIAICLLSFWVVDVWDCTKLCTLSNAIPQTAYRFIAFFLGVLFIGSGISFLIIMAQLVELDNRNASRGAKEMKKRTNMMALVFGLFVIFLVPLIVSAVYASSVDTIRHRIIIDWLVLIGGMNSVVNGVIYGFKRPEFRKAYIAILCFKSQNRIEPSMTFSEPHLSTVVR